MILKGRIAFFMRHLNGSGVFSRLSPVFALISNCTPSLTRSKERMTISRSGRYRSNGLSAEPLVPPRTGVNMQMSMGANG